MRGSDAGASVALVAERPRNCEGATRADAIVTDTALPEQTDAYLPDGVIILLTRKQIHKPMVLNQLHQKQDSSIYCATERRGEG